VRLRDLIILTVAALVAATAIATKQARADEGHIDVRPTYAEAEKMREFLEGRKEDWAVVSLRSYHFKRAGQNENNLGVGVELDMRLLVKDLRLSVGAYHNSSHDFSAYATAMYLPWEAGRWHFGATLGFAYGYGKDEHEGAKSTKNDNLIPFGALVAAWEGEKYGVNILLIPAGGGVVGVQGKGRF
jgi:hypothetical protein